MAGRNGGLWDMDRACVGSVMLFLGLLDIPDGFCGAVVWRYRDSKLYSFGWKSGMGADCDLLYGDWRFSGGIGIVSVSYTHLDVYKRQSVQCGDSIRSARSPQK